MDEYIKKQDAFDAITDLAGKAPTRSAYEAVWKSARALKKIPAADAVPVKHGRWLYKHRHRGGFRTYVGYDELGEKHSVRVDERYEIDEPYCSECGKLNESVWLNYCLNCGAKMDGVNNG